MQSVAIADDAPPPYPSSWGAGAVCPIRAEIYRWLPQTNDRGVTSAPVWSLSGASVVLPPVPWSSSPSHL